MAGENNDGRWIGRRLLKLEKALVHAVETEISWDGMGRVRIELLRLAEQNDTPPVAQLEEER